MHKRINKRYCRARARASFDPSRGSRTAEIVYEHLICHRLLVRGVFLSSMRRNRSRRILFIKSPSKFALFREALALHLSPLALTHSRRLSAACDIAEQAIHLTGHRETHTSIPLVRNDHSRASHPVFRPVPRLVSSNLHCGHSIDPLLRVRTFAPGHGYFGGFSTVVYP